MSDGSIKFDTKIETDTLKEQLAIIKKEITKTNKEIAKTENKIAEMRAKQNKEVVGSAREKIQADINREMEKLSALQKQFTDQTNEQTMLMNEKATLDRKITEIANYEKEIAKVSNRLNTLQERSNLMQATGDTKGKPFAKLQIEIDRTKKKLDELIAKKQIAEGGGTEGPKTFKEKMLGIVDSLKNFGSEVDKKHFSALADDQKKTLPVVDKLGKSFVRLGTLFKLMVLRMVMRSVINSLKEGFNNLVKYSSETQNSMNQLTSSFMYLKNSLATAFAPLLNIIAPIFSRIIDYISRTISAVAQLISLLTGKSTFVRAVKTQEKYGQALGGSAKQAKKLNKELDNQTAHIDELNIINEEIDNEDLGGGGAGAGVGNMFEEVPVDMKLPTWLDGIIARLKDLKDLFVKGFFEGLGDWKPKLEDIKNSFKSIGQSLKDIFTSERVVTSFNNMLDSIALNLGRIVGSIGNIGLSIGQGIVGGIANALERSKNFLIEKIANIFDNANIIADVVGTFAMDLAQFFSVLGSDSAKSLIGGIIAGISNTAVFLFDLIYGIFTNILKYIGDIIHNNIGSITEAFQSVVDMLAKLVDYIFEVWKVWSSFIKWVVSKFAPLFKWAFDMVALAVDTTLKYFINAVTAISQALGGLIDFVTGVFTGDWDKAWRGVANIFRGIWNGIVGALETALNWIVNGLNSLNFTVPNWIPFVGGNYVGFNIAPVNFGRLPMLAEGTVVPKQAGMFAAILGDNTREHEVVSPLSTIKQALREELANSDGVSSQATLAMLQEMLDVLMVIAQKDFRVEINDRVVAKSNDRGTSLNGFKIGFENR